MEIYAFGGDVKELKKIGYKFQKAYAKNYKTYCKDDIIMYVVSKMAIEITNLDDELQKTLIGFILENKEKEKSFWVEDRVIDLKVPLPYKDAPLWAMSKFGKIMSMKDWYEGSIAFMKKWSKTIDELKDPETGEVPEEKKEILREMERDEEFSGECKRFQLELIENIKALDNLHPLELIEVA